jgi:Na+-transporting NADH:ubiquinone oxidoreductase subunit NqrF
MNDFDRAEEKHDLDKAMNYYPDLVCDECGCELTEDECEKGYVICSDCDGECRCKQCRECK